MIKKQPVSNKMAVIQVLGNLCKNPLLLLNNNYKIFVEDFPERFHKIVFGAIQNLAIEGLKEITPIDVDQYLVSYPEATLVFSNNEGFSYLKYAIEVANIHNFEPYYNILKKYSIINRLIGLGFDVSEIYADESVVDIKESAQIQAKFNDMSLNDIITHFEGKILSVKNDYAINNCIIKNHIGDGAKEYKEQLKKEPEFGVSLTSPTLTTLYRGQRLGCLYLESSAQGVGKSRRTAAEATHLAVPEYYDIEKNKWVKTGFSEKVLMISTELDLQESQTMCWSVISGVPEHHILDGKYFGNEEERVDRAIKLLNESNFDYVSISNYNMDEIEGLIKEYYVTKGVCYFFYDYISTTIKIMSEGASKSKLGSLREDQILLMFCTRLKDLCKALHIFIWSATQLSGDWKNAKEADQQLLRGAKSLSDKIDIGSILLPVRESDKLIIEQYTTKGFTTVPTHVIHFYKGRRSRFTNIKLYIAFDRSLCRITDCFVTDNEGNLLQVDKTNVDLVINDHSEPSDKGDSNIATLKSV